jgi:predicted Zn-dependent peptidase
MYKTDVLNNGLKLITCNMPHMESAAFGIWINVGSRYENNDNNGIAHFLEHLFFKGSKKYSCKKIKQSIEGIGGSLNGFTSEELCCYLVKLPARHLNLALDILSDMVLNPLLPAKELEKERGVIIEEINMYKDLPASYVLLLLAGLLWPRQPLGASIAGTVQSVSSIKRESLFSFKEKFYTASNIVIVCCGRLREDAVLKKMASLFGRLKCAEKNRFVSAREKQNRPQLSVVHKDTEQTRIAMGFHALRRSHPDRFGLRLLHVILGANMSSRLFSQVREKQGIAYEISTQIENFADTGAFIIEAGIDNNKVRQGISAILGELKRIKEEPVSDREFGRAKDYYVGQLAIFLEDTLSHMLWVGESMTALEKIYTLDYVKDRLNKIRKEDLMRLSRSIFREGNINLAVIGPESNREKELYACLKHD